ncbi:nisin leader peptide-processing serine protease NisP [Fictibacillus phosphorivorans]|uniref:Nisin leader peptide-processing serine protease NisP n=1 Tax=Fictibacillus phosphorivorans TaxID=1221500 RepID=A0A165MZ92_9BACL|nr:S8 family serine peptidase [Fictibacillus phosphorivorans]KZE64007.1 nisin leader peptide-processing serine protease NisP [Fictibacillus phosphorivorans]
MKKLAVLSMCSVLSLSLFTGLSSQPAKAEESSSYYLLAYKGKVPSDVETKIKLAGGSIERVIEEIGIVEARSSDPNFLTDIKKDTNLYAADKELSVYLEDEVNPADGQPITSIPQPDWNDPEQNYHDYQWDVKRITNNFKSHELNSGNHETVVGVIDTGLDFNHPDLKANADLAGSKTFVPGTKDAWDMNGHGTHVAGSIAANGKVLGVGPELKVRAYRVFGATGGAQQSWITDAIVAAANDGVEVINMSIGGWRWMAHNLGEKGDSASMVAYHRAVQYATQKGVTVVVSAGNDSRNLNSLHDMQAYWKTTYGLDIKGPSRVVPAQLPGVVTVSSSNKWSTDSIAFYSNYGSSIDVAGPGGDNGPLYDSLYRQDPKGNYLDKRDYMYRTLSTWPTYLAPNVTSNLRGYALLHGTSMAAPKVAGIAAVIKSEHPEYSPAQVQAALKQTAVDLGKKGQDPIYGSGEANIYNALTR